jgi:NAD-dependent epimerase/dehydratase family protein
MSSNPAASSNTRRRRALIGSTGFIGGQLCRQTPFDDVYHAADIHQIAGRRYDLVVCAAPSAWKWRANQNPEQDRAHVEALIEPLRRVQAERFLLISTVDVYGRPTGVDETTSVDPALATPYGRHRLAVEETVRERFRDYQIVRLGHPFGDGLKKGFLYDLLHQNRLDLTHCENVFQFYPVWRLWGDLERVLESELPLVNIATEPASAREVARDCFGIEFKNVTEQSPVRYDMRSVFGRELGWDGPYRWRKPEVFQDIRDFAVRAQRATGNAVR